MHKMNVLHYRRQENTNTEQSSSTILYLILTASKFDGSIQPIAISN